MLTYGSYGPTVETKLYDILEVAVESSQSDILQAYQNAKSTFSLNNPEILNIFTPEEALAWNSLIDEAFHTIGDPKKRVLYDKAFFASNPRVVATNLFNFMNEDFDSKPPSPKATLPPSGFGATPLSQYKINPEMDLLIKKQDIFDGLFLKKIRVYKNVSLDDLSQKTCIAVRHLNAIENNNFSVLPASVFVRGYIIQYCRMLNLDDGRVVKSFLSLLANEFRV